MSPRARQFAGLFLFKIKQQSYEANCYSTQFALIDLKEMDLFELGCELGVILKRRTGEGGLTKESASCLESGLELSWLIHKRQLQS